MDNRASVLDDVKMNARSNPIYGTNGNAENVLIRHTENAIRVTSSSEM